MSLYFFFAYIFYRGRCLGCLNVSYALDVCMRMSTGKYIIRLLIIFHPGHVWMCWMFHKISSTNKEKILWIRKNNYIIFWLSNVYYYNILSGKNKYYAEEIYIHKYTVTFDHHTVNVYPQNTVTFASSYCDR